MSGVVVTIQKLVGLRGQMKRRVTTMLPLRLMVGICFVDFAQVGAQHRVVGVDFE